MSACERRRGVMVPMAEFRRSTGGITVVTEVDGEGVALRMRHDVGDLCWYDADDDSGEPRQVEPDREGVRDYGGVDVVGPLLDWWPTAGVPLPVAAGAPLLVCYADGAVRRLAVMRLAEVCRPDMAWVAWGLSGEQGDRAVAIGQDCCRALVIDRYGTVLAHAAVDRAGPTTYRLARPDLLPGDDPVASLAREWRVSVSAVATALGGGA